MTESIQMKPLSLAQKMLDVGSGSVNEKDKTSVLPVSQPKSQGAVSQYEHYDPVREKFSYAIAVQLFLVYLNFLYYESINKFHPLTAGLLLGGQSSTLAQSLNQYYHRVFNFNKHIKFYVWGMINGLLTTFWIQILVANVENTFIRFLLDQSVGACTFQLIFVLFNCLWERLDVRKTFQTTYITALKYSFMIWPLVSFLSFNYLREDLIFPINCFFNLIFTVILAILT